ncbi:unnamed protein product [Trifolium pratense]|uniref:Uncharacterized protein n=3 Tax=Trifolium pratense TaxID=57577 RepID=A0ACB0K7N2_TRIPR|nr:unnamed protein product [Trifolium pratense]CAJ2652866.1 unnamed protein product [Trifolium pratense]CAJ2652867.1 unnamed protein product [Trifolium pratense]
MEWFTWDNDKSFEENLLESPEEILEGQSLVPRQLAAEVKEHTQMIEEGNFELPTHKYDCIPKYNTSTDVNKVPPLMKKIKKVQHWKEEEHRLFLEGLEKYGKGNWKAISKYVGTKSYTQVASHAQKYFIRVDQQNVDSSKKSKRRSKFDTNLWNGNFHPLLYRDYIPPPPPPNVETQPIVEQLLQQFQQAQKAL